MGHCCLGLPPHSQVGHKAELSGEGQLELTREWHWGAARAGLLLVDLSLLICCRAVQPGSTASAAGAWCWTATSRAPDAFVQLPPTCGAGNSSRTLGEGAEMGDIALAAVVNLPALTEKLLAADGSGGAGDSAAQAAKPALLSAAAALASAASALAGSGKEQAAGAAAELAAEAGAAAAAAGAADVPSAADVQALLEEEINAMNRLLDGR